MLVAGERVAERYSAQMDDMMAMLFGARYLLVSMGLFSIYCGALYSDAFGVAFPLANTHYARPIAETPDQRQVCAFFFESFE